MMEPYRPTSLTDLWIADSTACWEALGFAVIDQSIAFEGITIHLGAQDFAWTINGLADDVDGLHTNPPTAPQPSFPTHPNAVTGIDHFVVFTPDFDRTAAALEAHDLPLRRIRDAGSFRQGFRRLGPAILELVEAKHAPPGPARFWGITLIASDLDALAARLGPNLRPIKDAVQPGRRIATLDRAAGLATHVAFMTPERS
jgi:hypothetical protein